ncbi:MOSC domain containing protein [Stackebrandtia nassauensis DSM 44728]|uniref:MOSC domain containing protein n=1 Tax=Stackebrandtia nassauensis (strain DSM 44728 / CIP 108903 / NRRL B-16338 / NBRC 102104 / LLR-40K-21) TaxID=446470 RepID=D3PZK8_STANL|nr:MOSC domain containing protein [Stackebrandtia nassauensis DSM 44728]
MNVGKVRDNPWKSGADRTGIDKRPVEGPVAVAAPGPKGTGAVGLAGDRVYDVKHHGGDIQAVYAYSQEDYGYWETELGRTLRPGMFGENLTTEGLVVSDAVVGERWRIGADVVLQVTVPRVPCGTFRGWMDEKGWLKTFTAAARTGAYLSVVEPGEIRAGDDITVESRPEHGVTVSTVFRALMTDRSLLPEILTAPELPDETRRQANRRLSQ